MGSPEMRLPVNSQEQVNGLHITVVAHPVQETYSAPGHTAVHEAQHAVLGAARVGVEEVSIIPGPGYNGITKLRSHDPVAAAGPHAMGMEGTSWDVHTIHASGDSIEGSIATARSMLSSRNHQVMAVANALEEELTLPGSRIEEIIYEADEKKSTPEKFATKATVFIKTSEKEVALENVSVDQGNILLPSEWTDIPQITPKQFSEN